jgi:hypothetical protein
MMLQTYSLRNDSLDGETTREKISALFKSDFPDRHTWKIKVYILKTFIYPVSPYYLQEITDSFIHFRKRNE